MGNDANERYKYLKKRQRCWIIGEIDVEPFPGNMTPDAVGNFVRFIEKISNLQLCNKTKSNLETDDLKS